MGVDYILDIMKGKSSRGGIIRSGHREESVRLFKEVKRMVPSLIKALDKEIEKGQAIVDARRKSISCRADRLKCYKLELKELKSANDKGMRMDTRIDYLTKEIAKMEA